MTLLICKKTGRAFTFSHQDEEGYNVLLPFGWTADCNYLCDDFTLETKFARFTM